MISHWEKETVYRKADYLILGAGITGLNAGIRLKSLEPKAEVVVVDRGVRGEGASYRNAGFACMGSPTELLADLEMHGESLAWETVRMRWEGLQALIQRVGDQALQLVWCGAQEIFSEEDRSIYESTLDHLEELNRRFKEITGDVRHFAPADTDSYKQVSGTIGFRKEGRLHPGKMMAALDMLARQLGVRILGGVDVVRLDEHPHAVELVTRRGFSLFADVVGLATNGFSQDLDPSLPVYPARNQVYMTAPIALGAWDTCLHYHKGYVYARKVGDRLLIGGGRHLDPTGESTDSEGLTAPIRAYLLEFVQKHFGVSCEFEQGWSGTLGVGEEKRPFIQQIGPRRFAGVRLGGMGVAIGTLVGDSLAHRMLGR